MKQILFTLSLIPLITSCNESVTLDMAENAIFYEAPANAAESIEAAWSPASLLQADGNTLYYADEATRKIVEFNVQTHEKRVLFDLSPFENKLFGTDAYDAYWGTALIRANETWIIAAAPQSPLIWMNPTTGEIILVGERNRPNAPIPRDGIQLKEVDFGLFGGIQRTDSGFYVVFGQQIFLVKWDGQSPQSLLDSTLKLVAGSSISQDNQTTNAREIALTLDDYTFLAELDGWLYFWSRPKLMAVKDGKIFTITGNGTTSSLENLEDFYAQRLPWNVPLIAHHGALWSPYWIPSTSLLRLEINAIDEETGKVSGSIQAYSPEVSALDVIAPFDNDFVCSDTETGNFRMVPLSNPDGGEKIFGPESFEERQESLISDPNSPYDSHAILGPLAIQTIKNGSGALIYSPTFTQLNYLNFETGSHALLMENYISHFASDGKNKAWLASGGSLYIMSIAEDDTISYMYAPLFFSKAPVMGVPCARLTFHLTEPPQMAATSQGLLLFAPNAHRIIQYQGSTDALTFLHEDGWYIPDPENRKIHTSAIQTGKITHWTAKENIEIIVFNHGEHSYLAVSNLSKATISFADKTISPEEIYILSGFEQNPIKDGQNIESTSPEKITAITLDNHQHAIAAVGSTLYSTSDDAHWHAITGPCADLPDSPESIDILGDNEVFIAKIHGEIYACSNDSYSLAGAMHQSGWSKIDANLLSSCPDPNTYVIARPLEICTGTLNQPDFNCTSFDQDSIALACDTSNLYAAAQDNHIYLSPLHSLGKPADFMGMGTGLPDEIALRKAKLGNKIGKIETDSSSNLYFWMRDTCTIWKIPNAEDMNENSTVYRNFTDEKLCEASAFTVTPDGIQAIIYNDALYLRHYDIFEHKGIVPGEVVDMISIDHKIVIMTTKGLYVWNGKNILLHAPNPIEIDGQTIEYAIPASYTHRMEQSPGEDAVLIPIFAGNRIIKVAI